MEGILMVGTFWFWALTIAIVLVMFVLTEFERWGWATFSIVATLALMHWLGDFSLFGIVKAQPLYAIVAVVGYLLLGTIWAFVKWWFYAKQQRRKYDKAFATMREDFERTRRHNGAGQGSVQDWKLFVRHSGIDFKPEVGKHKGRIYQWIVFWPWSLLWTMIDDPVKRMLDAIYDAIASTLQRISDKAWEGTE